MYKVCIVGCGMIAESAHLPAYRKFGNRFHVSAVCDNIKESSEGFAKRNGIAHSYTDINEMLESEKPDIVSVCTPNLAHKSACLAALEHGCNVLCEKPLAVRYSDASELFSIAKKHNKFLIACQSMRFLPERLEAKRLIDNGALGDIYYSQFARIRRRGIPTWGKFHIKEYSGGGALIDIGVHMIDSVLWLMGNPEIESVSASVSKRLAYEFGGLEQSGARTGKVNSCAVFNPDEMNVEDFASGSVLFSGGKRMNFSVAWAANAPEETSMRLLGDIGGIDMPANMLYTRCETDKKLDFVPDEYAGEKFPGHFHIIKNICDVLDGKAEPIIKPEETTAVAGILEMSYMSSELNREISLKEITEK